MQIQFPAGSLNQAASPMAGSLMTPASLVPGVFVLAPLALSSITAALTSGTFCLEPLHPRPDGALALLGSVGATRLFLVAEYD